MKYFLICDFSTISCERSEVGNILLDNGISFINHNNFFWELDVPDTFGIPFFETISENIHYLFKKYINRNSLFLVVKADEYYQNSYLDT